MQAMLSARVCGKGTACPGLPSTSCSREWRLPKAPHMVFDPVRTLLYLPLSYNGAAGVLQSIALSQRCLQVYLTTLCITSTAQAPSSLDLPHSNCKL